MRCKCIRSAKGYLFTALKLRRGQEQNGKDDIKEPFSMGIALSGYRQLLCLPFPVSFFPQSLKSGCKMVQIAEAIQAEQRVSEWITKELIKMYVAHLYFGKKKGSCTVIVHYIIS